MGELAVSAIGVDRPGLVAAITGVLAERGANVEDSAMTILGGQFAMMLLVATDDSAEMLRAAIQPLGRDLGLAIMVTPVEERQVRPLPSHVVSVYGTDRPGIIAAVSRALADLEVNITDLTTQVLPPPDQPVYAMALEIALPDDVIEDQTAAALSQVADALGVEYSMRPLEAETY